MATPDREKAKRLLAKCWDEVLQKDQTNIDPAPEVDEHIRSQVRKLLAVSREGEHAMSLTTALLWVLGRRFRLWNDVLRQTSTTSDRATGMVGDIECRNNGQSELIENDVSDPDRECFFVEAIPSVERKRETTRKRMKYPRSYLRRSGHALALLVLWCGMGSTEAFGAYEPESRSARTMCTAPGRFPQPAGSQ